MKLQINKELTKHTKSRLVNVAIAMYCNLRPPDAAPVILRLNYDAYPIPRLKSVNLPVSDLQRFYCGSLTLRFTLGLRFFDL